MGAVCLAILIFMPKVKMLAKIPPSLAAVAVGILMVKLMPISGKYNWRSVYNKQQPSIIPFAKA